jgi:hypothetical protein
VYNELMMRVSALTPVGPNRLGDKKMAITITLDDELVAGLENKAKKQQLSVDQLVLSILTEAVAEGESVTPREVVTRIQATAPNPAQIRPAIADLADALRAAPADPCFDLEIWNRQWSVVEGELKAIARANDVAEGRGG